MFNSRESVKTGIFVVETPKSNLTAMSIGNL